MTKHLVRLAAGLTICLLFAALAFYREGASGCVFAQETAQSSHNSTGEFKVRRSRFRSHLSGRAELDMWARERRLETVAEMLNRRISLPQDLYLSLRYCGEPDAYYDDEKREVIVCNELINRMHREFSFETRNRVRLDKIVFGAMTFIFFHEVAHALIDILNLPVTGREEDAADQFSALLLLSQSTTEEWMALDGANLFRLQARWARRNREPNIYWDEHSPDRQRFYDMICLLYGKNPKKYSYLVRQGTLPIDRGDICEDEFERASRAWNAILAPYLKEQAPPSR